MTANVPDPGETIAPPVSNPSSRKRSFGELLRFCLVGVANTAAYYAGYLMLLGFLPYLAAHLLAWAESVVVSFLLNCWFTYRVRPTWRRFALFPLSTASNVAMTTLGVLALVELAHVDKRLAPLIAGILAIPPTFLLTKVILTGQRRRATDPAPKP